MLTVFANGNGVPPTNGINLVYNNAAGGPIDHWVLMTTLQLLARMFASAMDNVERQCGCFAEGVNEVRVTGNLRGKPAIIVHGRS